MKIKIKDYEFELRYSMRAFINYEAITGKSLNQEDLQQISNLIILFYSFVQASAAYHKIQLNIDYNDFLDYIDENGGEVILVQFGQWYVKAATANAKMISKLNENTAQEGSKSSQKKS